MRQRWAAAATSSSSSSDAQLRHEIVEVEDVALGLLLDVARRSLGHVSVGDARAGVAARGRAATA